MKILVAAGSSGGHIFPALSFIDTLKAKFIDTRLIVPLRSKSLGISFDGYSIDYISGANLKLRFNFRSLIAIFELLKGALKSLLILLEFNPDIVTGFGGIDSLAPVFFGWIARRKTIIHEQNVLAGRANRLLARFVDRVAVSFAETKDYPGISKDRIILTGNPIRKELKKISRREALDFFGFNDAQFSLLVMGGSRGSRRINNCFKDALTAMPDKGRLQVIHIAGSEDFSFLQDTYKDLGLSFKLFSFLKEMQYAYSIADLALCRAGATTIAELINFRIPAIIVPYPYAHRHQSANASVLEKRQTAIVIEEDKLDSVKLANILNELVVNPEKLKTMRSHYQAIEKNNANDLLAGLALSLGAE